MRFTFIVAVCTLLSCSNENSGSNSPEINEPEVHHDKNEMVTWSGTKSRYNCKDARGMKQGTWKLTACFFPGREVADSNLILEEGLFTDDLKDGEWKYFSNDGDLDSLVYYTKGEIDSVVVM